MKSFECLLVAVGSVNMAMDIVLLGSVKMHLARKGEAYLFVSIGLYWGHVYEGALLVVCFVCANKYRA